MEINLWIPENPMGDLVQKRITGLPVGGPDDEECRRGQVLDPQELLKRCGF